MVVNCTIYWNSFCFLHSTCYKINVNQGNMKLNNKLNIILFIIALSFLAMCIFKTTELSLKCMQLAVSISCIGAMFSQKKYRYIFASIALIIWYGSSKIYSKEHKRKFKIWNNIFKEEKSSTDDTNYCLP